MLPVLASRHTLPGLRVFLFGNSQPDLSRSADDMICAFGSDWGKESGSRGS